MISKILIKLIELYRKNISPRKIPCCRFTPTCSEYGMQALAIHGALKGTLLTLWRVLRCNPLGKWGYDPVPEKGRWVNPARRLQKERRG